jgi:inorganic pyrophosphatase
MMTDEQGGDSKMLAMPINKECPLYDQVGSVEQMHQSQLNQIARFSSITKDLDSRSWVHA